MPAQRTSTRISNARKTNSTSFDLQSADSGDSNLPYKCSVTGCNLSFAEKSSLCRHGKEKHRTIGKYSCPVCLSTISRKYSWQKHVREKHNIDPETVDEKYKPTILPPGQFLEMRQKTRPSPVDAAAADSLTNSNADSSTTDVLAAADVSNAFGMNFICDPRSPSPHDSVTDDWITVSPQDVRTSTSPEGDGLKEDDRNLGFPSPPSTPTLGHCDGLLTHPKEVLPLASACKPISISDTILPSTYHFLYSSNIMISNPQNSQQAFNNLGNWSHSQSQVMPPAGDCNALPIPQRLESVIDPVLLMGIDYMTQIKGSDAQKAFEFSQLSELQTVPTIDTKFFLERQPFLGDGCCLNSIL